jgi:hypothetical protein
MDDRGQFCNEGAPQEHSAHAKSSTLSVTVTYHRNTSVPKSGATSAAAALAAGGASALAASLPDSRKPETSKPPAAAYESIKPAKFPRICSFSVRLPPNKDFNPVGAHVRLCSQPPLLCISAELETCGADAPCCLGTVLSCTPDTAHASLHTLHVEVFRHMLYLPGSLKQLDDGTLTEVLHVFPDRSDQLTAEIESRTATAEMQRSIKREADRLRAFPEITRQKMAVKRSSGQGVRVSYDDLGMLRLRDGFLLSQPFISDVIQRLFLEWYPDPDIEKRRDACASVFGSTEGPWDIFTIVKGLRFRPEMFQKLAAKCGFDKPEKDYEKRQLGSVLEQIYTVRNWWAHVQVTVANCRQALLAIKDFIALLPPDLKAASSEAVVSGVEGIISSISQPNVQGLSIYIDDLAYFYFGCACRHLLHVCSTIMRTCRSAAICGYLQRQIEAKDAIFRRIGIKGSCLEAIDVTRALLALNRDNRLPEAIRTNSSSLHFDCDVIRIVRNHFSHAPEAGNSVVIVLLALGSLSRLISLVAQTCLPIKHADVDSTAALMTMQADAHRLCSEINEWQALLLGRAGMLDAGVLVAAICQGYHQELNKNDYMTHARDDFQRLRLLVKGEITGSADVPSYASKLQGLDRKRERSVLNFVARVPPASAKCAESAVDWLIEQARSKNVFLQSTAAFFNKELPQRAGDVSVLDDAGGSDADVSRRAKEEIVE